VISGQSGVVTEMLLIAHHTITAGHESEVYAVLPELVEAARTEPGNLSFVAYRRLDDDRSYVLLERYASAEALDAHRETAHFKDLVLGRIVPRLESRVLETFEVGA
jgi:quinol monooxygenase YgiN